MPMYSFLHVIQQFHVPNLYSFLHVIQQFHVPNLYSFLHIIQQVHVPNLYSFLHVIQQVLVPNQISNHCFSYSTEVLHSCRVETCRWQAALTIILKVIHASQYWKYHY
jgi:hypothetical protein